MEIEKLREPKVGGMAAFDWTLSLLAAFIAGRYILNLQSKKEWGLWIFIWICIGVFVHKVLGIDTMLGYYLSLNPKPVR
jgi:hypothetical protein